MIETIKNAWAIPELRKKIVFTIIIILIFRVGSVIPVPFIDPIALKDFAAAASNTIFGFFDTLTGGAFAQATIFAMSITPYINASIIMQLLTIAIPALERLSKEGDEGRKKIGKYTRYLTVVIGLLQGFAYYMVLRHQYNAILYDDVFTGVVIVLSFTAGTAIIMWLGEQITEYGIGNGISIILFVGIISSVPSMVMSVKAMMDQGTLNIFTTIILVAVAIAIVGFVVFMTNAERRIPVQYAKRVIGRKMYGGQSTHIPMKVNMSGVMPIIFASTIVSVPELIARFMPPPEVGSFWYVFLNNFLSSSSWPYAVVYFLLIIFFNYFYVSIQFNPIEVSNNLKKNGGFIPGLRPGKPTSDFITKVLSKIIIIGALFLGLIAVMPMFFSSALGLNLYFGGTSLLIVVGVALDTVKQMESQMLMRHYKGFLE